MANWKCGAARNLPLAGEGAWDGAAAERSIWEWAGFNSDHPDSAKAKQAFLAYDASAPDLKGSYKLPFAMVSGGTLKAHPQGIRAAASRLPNTDIPDAEKATARGVIDHYESRMDPDHDGDDDADKDGDTDHDGQYPGPMGRSGLAAWHKELPRPCIKAINLDDGVELMSINRHTLEPVTKDDVYAYSMHGANDQYDRADERFPKSYLDRFAQTLPGKSVMPAHDYSRKPLGRIYAAEVRKDPDQDGGGFYLHVKAYTHANSEHAEDVRKGIAGHVSIGFQPDQRICDLCGKDYDGYARPPGAKYSGEPEEWCPHIAGQSYPEFDNRICTLTYGGDVNKVEGLEMSHVWLGCQRGAQTMRGVGTAQHKAAHFKALGQQPGQEESMKELEAARAALKELEAEVERLRPLAQDGEAYRKWLKGEIKRLYTSMEEGATGDAILKALDGADAAALDGARKDVDKRHKAAFAHGGAQFTDPDGEPGEPQKMTAEQILARGTGRRGGY